MKIKWIAFFVVLAFAGSIGFAQSTEKKPAPKKQASAKKANSKPAEKPLPKLLDLGSDKCIPCKMMTPILNELTKEYKGQLKIEFIDVWKDRAASAKYKIQSIPTQIIFDAKGKELYRHTGFYSKADILAKLKELGIKLTKNSK